MGAPLAEGRQDIPAVLCRCLFYPHPSAPSGFFPARAFFGARDIRAQYLSEKWHWGFRAIFRRIIFERFERAIFAGRRIRGNSALELGARENVGMGTGETRENWGFGARVLFGAKAKIGIRGARKNGQRA